MTSKILPGAALLATSLLAATVLTGAAHAATVIRASVFASAPIGARGPDSVTLGAGSVWISYSGGTDSQAGTGTSTIVRYSTSGAVQGTFGIAGSVDGLKYNPTTGIVYALQNQDGNSRLSLIDPASNTVSAPLSYGAPYIYGTESSRGYDDIGFKGSQAFLSYTNPVNPTDPVVQLLTQGNNPSGTLATTDVLQAGQVPYDSDSLKVTPSGQVVLTAGDEGEFTVVTDPGTATQTFANTIITDASGAGVSGLDDVLFPSGGAGTLYVTDTGNNRVLALDVAGLDLNNPVVAIGSQNALFTVDPTTGLETPLFDGGPLGALKAPHGIEFAAAAVPEPGTIALLGTGAIGLLAMVRRRR